ncbi:MAG TPA: hypothetical protein V6C91_07430 [Coleofasciculaceae cyanobacterium]
MNSSLLNQPQKATTPHLEVTKAEKIKDVIGAQLDVQPLIQVEEAIALFGKSE